MKRIYRSILLLAAALPAAFPAEAREIIDINRNWRFTLDDDRTYGEPPSTTAVGNGSTCRTTGASQALTTNGIRAGRKAASCRAEPAGTGIPSKPPPVPKETAFSSVSTAST